jgi:hypothetical protein
MLLIRVNWKILKYSVCRIKASPIKLKTWTPLVSVIVSVGIIEAMWKAWISHSLISCSKKVDYILYGSLSLNVSMQYEERETTSDVWRRLNEVRTLSTSASDNVAELRFNYFLSPGWGLVSQIVMVHKMWATSKRTRSHRFDKYKTLFSSCRLYSDLKSGFSYNSSASRTALGPTLSLIQWAPGALSLGVNRLRRESDHSPPPSAEVEECVEL